MCITWHCKTHWEIQNDWMKLFLLRSYKKTSNSRLLSRDVHITSRSHSAHFAVCDTSFFFFFWFWQTSCGKVRSQFNPDVILINAKSFRWDVMSFDTGEWRQWMILDVTTVICSSGWRLLWSFWCWRWSSSWLKPSRMVPSVAVETQEQLEVSHKCSCKLSWC